MAWNPYPVYSMEADMWKKHNDALEAQRRIFAQAADRALIESVRPAPVYKPAPVHVWEPAPQIDAYPRGGFGQVSAAPRKASKSFPWWAVWWLVGLVIVGNLLAAG